MRSAGEMDQADAELRATICKVRLLGRATICKVRLLGRATICKVRLLGDIQCRAKYKIMLCTSSGSDRARYNYKMHGTSS